jgi:4-hydroxybenzoate polyprenyltransferase
MIVLGIAFTIGMYYAFLDSPLLFAIGIAEGFFLFAYNLELFGGKFHNNSSTIISWAILPVFAGSAIQTNSISLEAIMLCGVSSIITYVLITTSRKYKQLKRNNGNQSEIKRCETILKLLTIGVLLGTHFILVIKIFG